MTSESPAGTLDELALRGRLRCERDHLDCGRGDRRLAAAPARPRRPGVRRVLRPPPAARPPRRVRRAAVRSARRCCRPHSTGTRPTRPRRAMRARSSRTGCRSSSPYEGKPVADGREPRRALGCCTRTGPDPDALGGLFLQSGSFFRRRLDSQESGYRRFDRITRFVSRVFGGRGDVDARSRSRSPAARPRRTSATTAPSRRRCSAQGWQARARRAPGRAQLDLLARRAPPPSRRAPPAGVRMRRDDRDGIARLRLVREAAARLPGGARATATSGRTPG